MTTMSIWNCLTENIEADESYFSGRRKGKRGRCTVGKVPVFSLLKRNSKVFTVIIPDAKARTLMPIIRQQVKPDSIVYAGEMSPFYGHLAC